jgi:RNA binding exosome subunit
LSSKFPVGYVDVRVFAHATEDEEKVLIAVRSVLPSELVAAVVFEKTHLTGHHGNPITLFETRVKERKAAQMVFERLASGLSILDKEELSREVEQHLEKGNLYVRLDKQSAYLGKLRLSSVDPVHLRVHFQKSSPEEVVEVCRRFGLLP